MTSKWIDEKAQLEHLILVDKLSYGKYCGPKCQFEHAHMLAYKKLLDGDESIMRANYSPKAFKKDILKVEYVLYVV